jgi:hypothetical protein
MGSKGGGGLVRLSDFDIWELTGLQNQLICCFMLAVDVVRGGIPKFHLFSLLSKDSSDVY